MKLHRIMSLAAALLLLGGLAFLISCFFTTFDGKWVLAVVMVWGFIGITAWTDGPELTR